MEELKTYVSHATQQSASDVHLVAGAVPMMRVHGELRAMKDALLDRQQVEKIANTLLSQEQKKKLQETGDVDVGMVVDMVGLRVNIHRQTRGLALAIRLIPAEIPTPEQLGFHETMAKIPTLKDGFVIISGPTGHGKSSTMAAIIQEINQTSAKHIITLEDPIEYRFTNNQSLIEQRQLGLDFPTFPTGLRHVLRQDPDVIMVGEMRDYESIALALTAAETGHLVISTLHAPNAPEAIERIVSVFEGAQQQQILVQLAATLRMVVAQRLLPKKDGGLVAAWEILTSTHAVQNGIRQNNLSVIRSAIQTGKKEGMISLEQSMKSLEGQLVD